MAPQLRFYPSLWRWQNEIYEIYDKELLAIMLALDEWRHYLMGAGQDFKIWTDHQNLQYFRKPQKLNHRQARWVTELVEYHFSLPPQTGSVEQESRLTQSQSRSRTGEGGQRWGYCPQTRAFPGIGHANNRGNPHQNQASHARPPPTGQERLCIPQPWSRNEARWWFDLLRSPYLYSPRSCFARGNYRSISRPYHGGTSWHWKDQRTHATRILVAQNEEGHRELCPRLQNVPMNKVEHPSKSSAPSSKSPSPPDLGHTSPLTWSLDYLGVMVKTLS